MTKPYKKRFSLSILLWMRKDKARQDSMNYWKGPHAQIIAASPELLEYRQLHLSENVHSFWPKHNSLKTEIMPDRRIDGIAEVTYEKLTSPTLLGGLKQTKLAFKDEINLFRRTLLYMGIPFSSRWYDTKTNADTTMRDILFLQRKSGTNRHAFKTFLYNDLMTQLTKIDGITEVRTQVYLPWHRATWNTPNVAHDNPKEHHLHASIILGFADEMARQKFYNDIAPQLNSALQEQVSALYTYQIENTLPFVSNSQRL